MKMYVMPQCVKRLFLGVLAAAAMFYCAAETRIGVYGTWHDAKLELEDYISDYFGFGLGAEFDITQYFGFSVGAEACKGQSITKKIDTVITLSQSAGFWVRAPLFSWLSLQSGVSYGALVHCIASDSAKYRIKNYYVDQQLRVVGGIRIHPKQKTHELAISGAYTFFPEKGFDNHQFGVQVAFFTVI